jgi:hypothetical protein
LLTYALHLKILSAKCLLRLPLMECNWAKSNLFYLMAFGVAQKVAMRRSFRRDGVYKTSQKKETHRVILLNWPRKNHISCQQKRSQASPASLGVPHFAVEKKVRTANKIKDEKWH